MAENSPNLEKDIFLYSQETEQTQRTNSKKSVLRRVTSKVQTKHKTSGKIIRMRVDFSSQIMEKEGVIIFFKCENERTANPELYVQQKRKSS